MGRGQVESVRQRQIDQENNMLLKKMLNIIKRKSSYNREHSSNASAMMGVGQNPVANNLSSSILGNNASSNGNQAAELPTSIMENSQPVNKSSDNRKSGAFIGVNGSNASSH